MFIAITFQQEKVENSSNSISSKMDKYLWSQQLRRLRQEDRLSPASKARVVMLSEWVSEGHWDDSYQLTLIVGGRKVSESVQHFQLPCVLEALPVQHRY